MIKHFDDNGDFEYEASKPSRIDIKTTCEFNVAIDGRIVGPASSTDRFYRCSLDSGCTISVFCNERYSIDVTDLPLRGESGSSDSMVEIIEDAEIDLYERLKADMFAKLSEYAESKNMDTFDDDDDFDMEEADSETPLTPYEHVEMYPEYYQDPKQAEPVEEKISTAPQDSEELEVPTPPKEPE